MGAANRDGLKPGSEDGLRQLIQQLRDAEQADSGLVRTLVIREEHEPNSLSMLVVFRERREGASS